jgi:hypothetical protein
MGMCLVLLATSRLAHAAEPSGAGRLFVTAGVGVGYVAMRFSDYSSEGYGEMHRIDLSGNLDAPVNSAYCRNREGGFTSEPYDPPE